MFFNYNRFFLAAVLTSTAAPLATAAGAANPAQPTTVATSAAFSATTKAATAAAETSSASFGLLSDTSRVVDLDEVVVVKQSREHTTLRHQGISSNVFSNRSINRTGLSDLKRLTTYVPSFVMPAYGSDFTPSVYVRGIGSRINSPSVGMYVNGMPVMNKSAFNTTLYDIDRVDFLRGPQSTLYGLNSEAGLLRLYSRDPLRQPGSELRIGVGSHFQRNIGLSTFQRVNNRLGWSASAYYTGQNGFFRNQMTGERADRQDAAGARLRLIALPVDRLRLDLTASFGYTMQNAYPYGELDIATGHVGSPTQNVQSQYERTLANVGLNTTYTFPTLELHSNTSFQTLRDHLTLDNDYSWMDFISVRQHQLMNAVTEELTLKSTTSGIWHHTSGAAFSMQWLKTKAPSAFGSAMKSVMGMDRAEAGIRRTIVQSMAARMGQEAAEAFVERMGGVSVDVDMSVPGLFHTPQLTAGAFHESTLDLTRTLSLTAGLRYDFTHTSIDYDTHGQMDMLFSVLGADAGIHAISAFKNHEHDNFHQLLPKLSLMYHTASGNNVYATVAKGYRAGGFNIQMFADIIQADMYDLRDQMMGNLSDISSLRGDIDVEKPHDAASYDALRNTISYKPEESWNMEVGTHLNLLGESLHLDAAAYYMLIRNQQLSVLSEKYGYGRMMVNAGRSRSIGAEVSLRGSLFADRLTYGAGYGYTHATFTDYRAGDAEDAADYDGNYVPYMPLHTFSAMADWRFDLPLCALRSITVGADVTAQGKTWWDEANTFSQPFYAVVGAHVAFDLGRYVVLNLWGRNLTQTHYNTFAFLNRASGSDVYTAQQGNPLQAGVDASVRF